MDSIDRYVLDFHACETQGALNAFWARVPEGMEDAIIDRLNELFPPDPNECVSDVYRLRVCMLNRGMDELDATMFARLTAQSCANKPGRTMPCERCDSYLLDFPAPED